MKEIENFEEMCVYILVPLNKQNEIILQNSNDYYLTILS